MFPRASDNAAPKARGVVLKQYCRSNKCI